MGMVEPSAHHIGKTKSAARLRTVKVSQKIFRSTLFESTTPGTYTCETYRPVKFTPHRT
jgi:hypothetical protein